MKKLATDAVTLRLKNIAAEAGESSFKAAKTELAETKQLLETIVQGITDGIILVSKDFKILWTNKAILKTMGCMPEEIIGKHCYRVAHKKESLCVPSDVMCPIKEVIRTGKPVTVTHTHFDKQNNKRFVEVAAYPIRDKNGHISQFVHITRDVTEQKASEEKIKESELSCRTIFNSVNDAIVIYDVDSFKLIEINDRGCEMFSIQREKIKGMGLEHLTCDEEGYLKSLLSRYFEKAAHDDPQLFEWKFKDKTGRCFWVDINLKRAVIHGSSRLIAVIRDISKRPTDA